jgi:glycosyltransferase involved in cell wall biosynthesis
MGKVEQSMLMSGAVECRVIPNGVDLKIFNSQGRPGARETLGIPAKSRMLLFTANSIRNNPWKDYQMLRAVLEQVRMRLKGVDLLFVALGEDGPSEQFGRAELRFVPYQKDPRLVAHYYQAADVYVHPAKIETFCLSVIEAAACGTPVVATDVGGLSEQIENGKTGYLVPSGDSVMMAERIVEILQNNGLWLSMEVASAERARRMYCMGKHANEYLEWYNEIIEQRSQKRVEA